MNLKKNIKTTIKEYLNEQSQPDDDYAVIKNVFDKVGTLIGFGKNSFVFEYSDNKAIKIKNTNNEKYSDYGFYKTYDVGEFKFNKDVLTIDNKYLNVTNNTLYYVIMEKLNIPKKLVQQLDDLEFEIKQYIKEYEEPPLRWLFKNINNDEILIDLLEHIENTKVLPILSDLLHLFTQMKHKNIEWLDIHKNNFGYNKNNELIPFDLV